MTAALVCYIAGVTATFDILSLLLLLGKSALRAFLPSLRLPRCKNLDVTINLSFSLGSWVIFISFYCSLHSAWLQGTGKLIVFERQRTAPEIWLVLEVGFDPLDYVVKTFLN